LFFFVILQANNQKHEAFRMFEEKISTLELIYDRHTSKNQHWPISM